ncbi:MAG: InlB B-repeat-containing protein, partial [Paludibacteraceae bacterium]|nr:InlB B-repeat-containing protein [Paludibacteraceae bacterium]
MKSKIRKVTWLVWALLMLSGAGAWAATFGDSEGGVTWSYDTETHCLTISPKGSAGTVNRVSYPNGVTANYSCKWNYGYSGTPAWLSTRYTYRDGKNNKNIDLKSQIQCVIVEEGVTKIGAAAFRGLSNLKSVQLPSTLTTISVEAFRETGIETLRIPENVCEIGDRWITDAFDLNMISVDSKNKCFVIDTIYGALFTADMETLVRFPIDRCVKEVRIPEGVRKMATDAMYQLDCVEEIILPSTLDTVQYAVFDWCNNLKTIRFSSENPPVFASDYNLNPGDTWNYNQMSADGKKNRNNLMIYIPCTPDSTFNERTGKYEKVTKIDADSRIKGWLADFVIVATPVEESADGTPVSTEKGIAWVETKRTCDNDTTKIVAEAAEGARFIQWKQKSNGFITKDNPYTFALGVSDTFYAYFAKGQYGVTALVNDTSLGVTSGSGVYTIGSNVTLTAKTKNSCAKFEKWNDGVTTATRTITVGSKDTTVTAIFSRYTYTVSASSNNYGTTSIVDLTGKAISNGSSVGCGDTVVFVATPNSHSSFVEWSDGNKDEKDTVVVNSNITLTATFVQDSFLVRFLNEDGTKVLCEDKYVYGEIPSCSNTEKAATDEYTYTFNGWTPTVAAVSEAAEYKATYTQTANKYDFKAIADNKTVKDTTIAFGDKVEMPTAPDKKGYTFKYWMDEDSTQVIFPFNMAAHDTTVLANYVIDTFTLNYYNYDSTVVLASKKYIYDADVTLLNEHSDEVKDKLPREGYKFTGWDPASITKMPDNDVNVYARYSINSHKLIVKDSKGTEISNKDVDYATEITEPSDNYGETGYTCDGWINEETGNEVTFPFSMPDNDVVLKANCTVNQYSLVFKTDEDATDVYYQYNQNYNSPIDTTNVQDPTKEGYTFAGWNKAIPTRMPAYNDTIVAKWTINQYKYVVIKNNGEKNDTTVYDYNAEITLPSTPDREGYTFTGWNDSTSVMPAKNLVVEGSWTINQYKYVVIKNNGEKNDTTIYDYNAEITLPSTPDREGYTFTGWNDSTSVMPAKNLVVEGSWTINQYKYVVIKNNGEKNDTTVYDYNAEITLPSTPDREG